MKNINKIWALALVLIIGAIPFVQAIGAEVGASINVGTETESGANIDGQATADVKTEGNHRALANGQLVMKNKLFRNKLNLKADNKIMARGNLGLNDAKIQLPTNWKERFLESLDKFVKRLEKVKTKIEASHAENKDEIIVSIDIQIEAANQLVADVKADEEITRDEAKEYTKNAREIWSESKTAVKIGTTKLVNVKIAGIIKKAEKLEERLNKAVEKFKAKGKNTTEIEVEVNKFKDNLVKAKEEYNAALELQKSAGTTDETMKQVNEHLINAHKYLKDGNVNLKAVIKLMRTSGGESA